MPWHLASLPLPAGLHATLAGGNLDAREVEKAKAGQQADFPDVRGQSGEALSFSSLSP